MHPFVNIQAANSKPPQDPDQLNKLKEVDQAIEKAKIVREEANTVSSELGDLDHPSEREAAHSVEDADKILNSLIVLRHEILKQMA